MPAAALGMDWVGVSSLGPSLEEPHKTLCLSGSLTRFPRISQYDVVIVQQPNGQNWERVLDDWAKKVTLVYEIDDFVHGVHKIEDHPGKKGFNKKTIKSFQRCMDKCDAMICSTDFLSNQYKKYNPNQYVCKLGIDTSRYVNIEFPAREDSVTIGWSGHAGHHHAVGPWLEEIIKIMDLYENVNFMSIGIHYADILAPRFPGRTCSALPTTIENYPYTLTSFDISIAPSHCSKYHLSKSDLRWVESAAMGIPCVVAPEIYPEVEDYETGLVATTPKDAGDCIMEYIESEDLRKKIGYNAQTYVQEHRDYRKASRQWEDVLLKVK